MIISLLHEFERYSLLGGLRVSVWQHRNVELSFWHFGAAAAEESYGIIPIPFRVVAMIAYGVSFSIFFRLGTV